MTSIAGWQIDATNNGAAFYYTILSEMRVAILEATAWVEEPNAGDVEYWKRYRHTVEHCLHTSTKVWEESPDTNFNALWTAKYQALNSLYHDLHILYVKHSFEPYQADVYREKVDQALDYLTDLEVDSKANPLSYPFLQADADVFHVDMKTAALHILNKRAEWISKMVELERIRIPTKQRILKAETSDSAVRIINKMSEQIENLDKSWT